MTLETGKPIEEMVNHHQRRGGVSLRARITLAITATAIFAALAIGFLASERYTTTQTFLGNQFQESEKGKAELQIQALAQLEAQNINQIFVNASQSVTSIADFTSHLLDQSNSFEAGLYWNATQKLSRLQNGAWDNPNNDIASVFMPANIELGQEQVSELNTVVQLDSIVPNLLRANSSITAIYYISSKNMTVYYPNIDLANLVPADFKATNQSFYTDAVSLPQNGYAWSLPYQDPALTGLIVTNSSPVYDKNGTLRGVIGADLQLAKIKERVLNVKIGKTGYAFLIDAEGHIIAMPDTGYTDFDLTPEEVRVNEVPQLSLLNQAPRNLQPYFQNMTQGGIGLYRIQIHETEHYLAYTPITSTKYSLGVLVPVGEMDVAFREAQTLVGEENQATRNFGLALLAGVVVAASAVSLGLSQVLTNPLKQLTSTAQQVSAGDLTAQAPKSSVSEVSVLANAFNIMTSRLKETLAGLEERVAERTTELGKANQQIQHRASQFEAIAQVARNISTSQNLETLLPKITNVISERFGFYHVGIFLLDAAGEFAVLRAANSPGGKKMLERTHQLKVGEIGIVGYATGQGMPRIALDTGSDAVFFDNPDLPETRSEMALPLIVSNQVIGALDVQSVEPNAFSQEDVNTLSTLADQVSIAIQNARLYEETRQALAQSQMLYQQFTQTGWKHFTHAQKLTGIRRNKANTILLREPLATDSFKGNGILDLPIKLRGQKIGVLKVRSSKQRQWSQDDIDIATAIIERAAIALENARLLDDAQRRASREQIIGEISTTVSSSTDMEEILRSAVQELGRKMGGAEVVLELGADLEIKGDAK